MSTPDAGTTKVTQTLSGGTGIASAQPTTELTPEQKKARFRELAKKSRLSKDQSTVIGDPSMHYFWAANDVLSQPELIRLQSLGYVIVREPQPKEVLAGTAKPKIQAAGLRQDGTYVRGDVILTQVPKEDYEFLIADIEQRHEEGMSNIQDEFRSQAEQNGSPTFVVSNKK